MHRSAYPEAQVQLVRALKFVESSRRDGSGSGEKQRCPFSSRKCSRRQRDGPARRWRARTRGRGELCLALRDESSLLQATWGLIAVSIVRAELRKTQGFARDMLRLAKKRRSALFGWPPTRSSAAPRSCSRRRRRPRDISGWRRRSTILVGTVPGGRVRNGPRNFRPDLGDASDVASGLSRSRACQRRRDDAVVAGHRSSVYAERSLWRTPRCSTSS